MLSLLTFDIDVDGDGFGAAHGVPRLAGVGARVSPGGGAEADLGTEAEDVILAVELRHTGAEGKDE